MDANTGIKKYSGVREGGTLWEKVKSWFGYKLHLVVDTVYELLVAFSVTKASEAEIPEGKNLIKKLKMIILRYLKDVNTGLETEGMMILTQ